MGNLFNQKKMNKKKSPKVQAANYLKSQLNHMINDQLKSYRVQKKLQQQLETYKKNKERKQLIQNMHKVQKFRSQQSQKLKNKLDEYMKNKQKKQYKIQEINSRKQQLMNRKKSQNTYKLKKVLQKHYQAEVQDISSRLSRVSSITSNGRQKEKSFMRKNQRTPRHVSSAQCHRDIIKSRILVQQQKRVTNYINKMRYAQNRILNLQIKNQQRKQRSIKSQIKNLTGIKNMKEQQYFKTVQQKFKTKMDSFLENSSRCKLQNSTVLMNKSMMKSSYRQKVLKNKQLNQTEIANKIIQNFMKKNQNKQNINQINKKKLDLLKSKTNFINKTIKLQKQALFKENQKNFRILYEKLVRIKRMKPNQLISQKQRQQLLSLIDPQDPQYSQILQFLTNSRSQFLRKKLQKQQQKAKAQKAKKTARFTNKV